MNDNNKQICKEEIKISRLVDEIGQLTNKYSLCFIRIGNRTELEALKSKIIQNQKESKS